MDSRGEEKKGTIDASSQEEARDRLKEMGFFPTKIVEAEIQNEPEAKAERVRKLKDRIAARKKELEDIEGQLAEIRKTKKKEEGKETDSPACLAMPEETPDDIERKLRSINDELYDIERKWSEKEKDLKRTKWFNLLTIRKIKKEIATFRKLESTLAGKRESVEEKREKMLE
jgi:hypothetical protein